MQKIVTIGGGTGSFTLLSGLKKYPFDLTAIVTMADDGGSTGVLRDELGVLPPGDVRQCLVALSDSSEIWRALMNYRFADGEGLRGHSFGNLFLSALEKITGSFSAGVAEAAEILDVRGRVVPVSEGDMRLRITLEDGTVLEGERELDENSAVRRIGIRSVALTKRVRAHTAAVDAIMTADLVIIGPGDHFGSIMPNILVTGIARALKKTAARVVFIVPLTNKRGHTSRFCVEDYIRALEEHIGRDRIDYVVYNTRRPAAAVLAAYTAMEGEESLVQWRDQARERHCRSVSGDFLRRTTPRHNTEDAIAITRSFIRHDPDALGRAVMLILAQGDAEIVISS